MAYKLIVDEREIEFECWHELLDESNRLQREGKSSAWVKLEKKPVYRAYEPVSEIEHMIATIGSLIPRSHVNYEGERIKPKGLRFESHPLGRLVDDLITKYLKGKA